ncbi:MAG TPA: hypothetical protein VER03_04605, partial [Bryobacteraceae bacterium]|nr:hypothetical protein [Bryobacteraceae bacterium]
MRGLCLIFVLWTVSLHGTGAGLQYSDVQKRWALATSAILAEMNGGSHDPLSVFAASELTSDKSRRMLWEQRGVRTRRELLEKIEDTKWSGQMRRNTAPDSGHAASSR